FFKARLLACQAGPSLDGDIDIGRINLDTAEAAPCPFSRYQCGARAQKDIEDEIAMTGHIPDGIRHHPRRLDGGMQRKILATTAAEGVDRRIIPDIGPVAA